MEQMSEDKVELVHKLVDQIIIKFNDEDVPPDVALSSAGHLFAVIARDCNLDAEQFIYLCTGIGEKMFPNKEKKNEKAKQEQPSGREPRNEKRKGKRKEAKL